MQKQFALWSFVQEKLLSEIPVALLYVLESKGSSPGRQGFGMAITATGEMIGSIGGGMMEHKMVELAKTLLHAKQPESIYQKQIHNKSAAKNQSGMICSGEQSVFLQVIPSSSLLDINRLVAALTNQQNGTLEITNSGISFHESLPESDFYFQFKDERDFLYREKTGYRQQLYVVGGGHCALAFSKLMRDLDFKIYLIEERPNLNTLLKNEYAHEIILVNNYSEIGDHIPDGKNHYVVIMTFGYRTDAIAIRSLQYKKLAYLGMLGSRNKIDTLFNEMEADNLLSNFTTPVHAPIGLSINSRTPEEIAVSIAGQIIQVKNNR
ncbi:MAG: XdhC family protein [Bacteroidetes bacterium]|nr:XdhC family protein [Bacteroidota bacterium]